jgi:hypothetical protein
MKNRFCLISRGTTNAVVELQCRSQYLIPKSLKEYSLALKAGEVIKSLSQGEWTPQGTKKGQLTLSSTGRSFLSYSLHWTFP